MVFTYQANMEEKNYTGTVPGQEDGYVINAQSIAETNDPESAKILFQKAKIRLLNPNNWHKLAGELMAEFQLTDNTGQSISGPAEKGNYFRIDIPGPGTKAGEGYDWAVVEEIEKYTSQDVESIGLRVRPASNPLTDNTDIAHFYSGESTSTFTISREKTRVTAAIYDRNTKANTESGGIIDKARNILAAIAGMFSFSKIQWKNLTDGFIRPED